MSKKKNRKDDPKTDKKDKKEKEKHPDRKEQKHPKNQRDQEHAEHVDPPNKNIGNKSMIENLSTIKSKQQNLETRIAKVLNEAGKGDLKFLRALAQVINLIKDEYSVELKRLKNRFTTDKPAEKIIVFFTKQVYLRLYIKYSIKYINNINFQFTPEFKQKFIENIQKVRALEVSLEGDHKDFPLQKGEQVIRGVDQDDFRNLGRSVGLNQKGVVDMKVNFPFPPSGRIPGLKKNEGNIPEDVTKNRQVEFDAGLRRQIIIELLKTYDIRYDQRADEIKLLYTLKDGLAELMKFITESIDSGPKNIHMLENLQNVRSEMEG